MDAADVYSNCVLVSSKRLMEYRSKEEEESKRVSVNSRKRYKSEHQRSEVKTWCESEAQPDGTLRSPFTFLAL